MKRNAPNASDLLADRITTHQVNLLRFDADLRKRIARMLRDVEADIVRQLHREDPSTIARPTFRERRLIALSEQVRAILRTQYRAIANAHAADMRELAGLETEFTRSSINRAITTDIMTVGVPESMLRELARHTLIDGSPALNWWAGQSDALQKRFTRQMRIGLAQGETVGDLARRVRGTREKNFTDGVMQATRREAELLVRTSVSAVSNAARLATYEANDDVVQGVQQHSTLDGRTTVICISLSGASWRFDGTPFPDSPYQGTNPPFPRHWGERSVLVARLYPLSQIVRLAGDRKAARLARLPESTQASMDGQVAASLTCAEWLKGKSAEFQDSVLGKTRAELWRRGKLDLDRLIDQSGNPLSLEGLRRSVRGVTRSAIDEARVA